MPETLKDSKYPFHRLLDIALENYRFLISFKEDNFSEIGAKSKLRTPGFEKNELLKGLILLVKKEEAPEQARQLLNDFLEAFKNEFGYHFLESLGSEESVKKILENILLPPKKNASKSAVKISKQILAVLEIPAEA